MRRGRNFWRPAIGALIGLACISWWFLAVAPGSRCEAAQPRPSPRSDIEIEPVGDGGEGPDWREETGGQEEDGLAGTEDETKSYLLEEFDFRRIDEALEELFPEEKLGFKDIVAEVLAGNVSGALSLGGRLLKQQLTYAFAINRESLVHMLLIALVAAVFTNFGDIFKNRQISDISFYILYMLLIALCLSAFQAAADWTGDGIDCLTGFMKALGPVYFVAVAVAKGSMTAAAFYNLILLLIFLIELLILKFLLPALHIYMMVKVLNYLSQEEYLSRFTDLIETVVQWTLKTLLACVIGLNAIQGLIAPAVDSVKRSIITRGAEAIPGVGDAIGGTAEVILGTAVVVKNSIGVAGAVVCIAICIVPLAQIALLVLLYKLAAAFLQPVSDKRLVGCIGGMADGCQLLLQMIFTTGVLFLLTIAIVAATTSGT